MKLVEIALDLIDEDTDQPRRQFDEAAIDELVESIREVGLLTPIKVRKAKYGRYKIVFGNRRYKALKRLGFRKIPCILSDDNDELSVYFEQLTENIQRDNFTPIEEALAFEKLLDSDGKWKVSKKYLSSRLGKSEKYIGNKLSLLVFGPDIRKIIHNRPEIIAGKLSEEQALSLKDVPLEYRDQLALKVAKDQRSTKDIKRIAQLFTNAEYGNQEKEKLLAMKCQDLVVLSVEKQANKIVDKTVALPQVAVIDKANQLTDDNAVDNRSKPIAVLHEEVNRLAAKIPEHCPLSQELLESISEIELDEKNKMLDSIRLLTECLENHILEWTRVKALLEKQ